MIQFQAKCVAVLLVNVPVTEGSKETQEAYRMDVQMSDMQGLPIVGQFWMELTPEQARSAGNGLGTQTMVALTF